MIFSGALVVLGVVEANLHFVQNFLSPEDFGLVVAGIGLATGILRKLTKAPLEDK